MTDNVWHYAVRGEQKGPVDERAMKALVDAGVVSSTTPIWKEGMGDWEPAYRHISGLVPPSPGQAMRAMGSATAPGGVPDAIEGIGFVDAVKRFWAQYASFSGRASRSEYWWAYLGMIVISILVQVVDLAIIAATGVPFLTVIFALAILIPSLAIAVRRLHDTDRSGWWYLIIFVPFVGVIVLLVFFCTRGTQGPNRFGNIERAP
jgi:uncharacterized membrane protein YhaH (DUF805 family)